jgi:hypothetical protein
MVQPYSQVLHFQVLLVRKPNPHLLALVLLIGHHKAALYT